MTPNPMYLPPPPGAPFVAAPPERGERSLAPGLMAVIAALGMIAASLVLALAPGFSLAFSAIELQTGGTPIRWNPCQPVHYVVNLDNAPPSALADTRMSAARVSAASGIPFVFDGTTTEVPSLDRQAYQPSRYGDAWAPVLVAWMPNGSFTSLRLPKIGLGLPIPVRNASGQLVYVSGMVVLNAGYHAPAGFAETTDVGSVVLHEFGHLAGLGHVRARDEVMYPNANGKTPTSWGSGDRLGLLLLGRASGCLQEPTPHPTQGDWQDVHFPPSPGA